MYPTTYSRRNQEWLPSIFNEFASPAVNVIENEKDYTLELAAPGMTKDDFSVRLENDNELVISLQKKEEKKEEQAKNYLRREFSYASYQRTFLIPDEVDIDAIAASMTDGVLSVTLPKKEPVTKAPASRQISIC